MEKKMASGSIGHQSGRFPIQIDHQSLINQSDREKKFNDKKKNIDSHTDYKLFEGISARKFKLGKNYQSGKLSTNEKYLQDSYEETFQKHVDNLTNVISEHKKVNEPVQGGRSETRHRPVDNSNAKNNTKAVPLAPLTRLEIKTEDGLNQIVTFDGKDDGDESKERKIQAVAKKGNVVMEKLDEDEFFEFLMEPCPKITFSHVCTEEQTNRIGFHQVQTNSRSPSPMLEVPDFRKDEKNITRPPI